MKNLMLAMAMLVCGNCFGADIVITGELIKQSHTNWRIVGRELVVEKERPYLLINTEGNCHYEHKQECHTTANGQVICNTIPHWVCDNDRAVFKLPESIQVTEKEVLYTGGNENLKIGTRKGFLWFKWVSLESNIGIFSDIATASLIIRNPQDVSREIKFQSLHSEE